MLNRRERIGCNIVLLVILLAAFIVVLTSACSLGRYYGGHTRF